MNDEQVPGGLPFGLREVATNIQQWLDWNKSQRDKEHLTTDDGTTIMCLPVPYWPGHGGLSLWVKTNKLAADEIERLWAVNDRLRDLVKTLIEEDPNADAADGGVTVLDVWRKSARATLGYQ